MGIGAITFEPYLYHVGGLSGRSLDAVDAVPEDALVGGTDFTDLASEEENPLRRGETRGFMDILAMQLELGSHRASQLGIAGAESDSAALSLEEMAEAAPDMDGDSELMNRMSTPDTEEADKARALRNVSETVGDVNTTSTVQGAGEDTDSGMYARTGNMAEFTPYQMNRALDSYAAWMSA